MAWRPFGRLSDEALGVLVFALTDCRRDSARIEVVRFADVRSNPVQLVDEWMMGHVVSLWSRFLYSLPPRPVTGVVSVDPFFAKIIASSCAGSVWLGLPDSSCTAPGGSKNISPTL